MRTSKLTLNKSLEKQIKNIICQLVVDTKSTDEADEFFSALLTESEYETFSKRLAIAYWLKKGRSYENIKTNLKVSSATIASVNEMMKKKGIQNALKKIEAEEWANQWSDRIKKFLP